MNRRQAVKRRWTCISMNSSFSSGPQPLVNSFALTPSHRSPPESFGFAVFSLAIVSRLSSHGSTSRYPHANDNKDMFQEAMKTTKTSSGVYAPWRHDELVQHLYDTAFSPPPSTHPSRDLNDFMMPRFSCAELTRPFSRSLLLSRLMQKARRVGPPLLLHFPWVLLPWST
jgi:hypothetical protein